MTDRRRMLSSRWTLHDVDDVEQECRIALDQGLRRHNARLTPDDYDDALAFLLGEVSVVVAAKYDPACGATFRTYLDYRLPQLVVDYYRRRFGSTGHRRPPAGSVFTSEIEDAAGDLPGMTTSDTDPHEAAAISRLDTDRLTLGSAWLLDQLTYGKSAAEIAAHLGESQKLMGKRMTQLRDELRYQGIGTSIDEATIDTEEAACQNAA